MGQAVKINVNSLLTACNHAAANGGEVKLSEHTADAVAAKRRIDLENVIVARFVRNNAALIRYVRWMESPLADASDKAFYKTQIAFFNQEVAEYETLLHTCGYDDMLPELRRQSVRESYLD